MEFGRRRGLAITCALMLPGCTRPNPAFLETAGQGATETDGTSVADGPEEGGVEGVDAGGDDSDSAADAGEESDGETTQADEGTDTGETDAGDTDGVCEIPPHDPKVVLLQSTAELTCDEFEERAFLFLGVADDVMSLVGPCPNLGCAECGGAPVVQLSFPGIAIEESMPPGGEPLCFELQAENLLEQPGPQACAFSALSIFEPDFYEAPTFGISFNDYGIPLAVQAYGDAINVPLQVQTLEVDVCECSGAVCCTADMPPTQYELKLGSGEHVPAGEFVSIAWDGLEYQFNNLASHRSTECGVPRDVHWAFGVTGEGGLRVSPKK